MTTTARASRTARVSCRCDRRRRASRSEWTTPGRSQQPVRRRTTSSRSKHRAREITLAASRRGDPFVRVRRSARCTGASSAKRRELIAEAAAYLAEAERALDEPSRRALRRLPPRRQEGVRRGEPHARVRRRQPHARPPPSSASRCRRTSTGWPRPRASCGARCSTACAANEGDEAERLLAVMDDVYGLLDHRSTIPTRSPAGCGARPTRCARCSSAPAATSPPRIVARSRLQGRSTSRRRILRPDDS